MVERRAENAGVGSPILPPGTTNKFGLRCQKVWNYFLHLRPPDASKSELSPKFVQGENLGFPLWRPDFVGAVTPFLIGRGNLDFVILGT